MIKPGAVLSRVQIAAVLGGSIRPFLPELGRRAVAACIDPRLNPDAPHTVRIGPGLRTLAAARRFAASGHAVPLFLRQAAHCWLCLGLWRATTLLPPDDITAPSGTVVAAVMTLAEVPTPGARDQPSG